ncbi:hypothetical protein [Exiguobacterium antarcticum]|uniref:hypothetical protein n=1 Tax=Exiguobacterium antarcticum TaxID=132920 RepID=UPI00047DB7AA|nr:hypothetical protein [Exiguobacterium antarcticum]
MNQFVRQTFDQANIVMYADNLTIPQLFATGTVDVMITGYRRSDLLCVFGHAVRCSRRISEKWISSRKKLSRPGSSNKRSGSM